LSLSRLNHRLLGCEAHLEVVQGTADFHHDIADALLPEADPVFHDATALDTAVHVLDAQPTAVQGLVGQSLLQGELLATWFLRRHEDLDLRQCERQEAQLLQEPAPKGQGRGGGIGNTLVMDASAVRVAQKEDHEEGIDEQDIFDCVVLFLATIILCLFSRVLGADDAPFRPLMGTRGDASAAVGTATTGAGSSSGAIMAAEASATPSRCVRVVRERAGASSKVRRAVSLAHLCRSPDLPVCSSLQSGFSVRIPVRST
jgi:hypothetical protein